MIYCSQKELNYYKAFTMYKHDSYEAFANYRIMHNFIPVQAKIFILLSVLYAEFPIIPDEFLDMLNEALAEETKKDTAYRMKRNKEYLKDYIDAKGEVTVYRGINDHNYSIDGISYSLDKDIASLFALEGCSSRVMTCKAKVSDILWVNGAIGEAELIIFPKDVEILDVENVYPNEELSRKYTERTKEYEDNVRSFILHMEEEDAECVF